MSVFAQRFNLTHLSAAFGEGFLLKANEPSAGFDVRFLQHLQKKNKKLM